MSHKRSSSMNPTKYRARQDNYDDEEYEECGIVQYRNKSRAKNNCMNDLVDTNFDGFLNAILKGYSFEKTKVVHPDGTVEFMSRFYNNNKTRQVTKTIKETKTERVKDYGIRSETKSYQTGLIFKDTHYYQTQKVVPKDYYVNYERTVTYYDDGTVNYGDWRRVSTNYL